MLQRILKTTWRIWLLITAVTCNLLWPHPAATAPTANLWPHWQISEENSTQVIDHRALDTILAEYLITDHPSAITRFRYRAVTRKDRQRLDSYLTRLQEIKVSTLNRREQKAFWINLYNALTIKVILDHYPVKTIMDIDISPGFFSNGPWDAKLLIIEGVRVSLNDIEHRILRPIFKDNRVHYALNCASLGCPNIQPRAFTALNMVQLLEVGAKNFINHPRGVKVIKNHLQISSIYKWFQPDFGGSEQKVIDHLLLYAQDDLSRRLRKVEGRITYQYNWDLNE